jgi:hypothetical protein
MARERFSDHHSPPGGSGRAFRIASLTIPSEITSHFKGTIGKPEFDQFGSITNSVTSYLSNISAGSTYDFSSPYG